METRVSSATKVVLISDSGPTVLIGECINPTGRNKLAAALQAGNMDLVRREAQAQVLAGADILDVNVGVPGVDQVTLLPQAVQAIMDTVDIPLCLDSDNPAALREAVKVYRGKPIINSVTGQERSLEQVLPLVREYGTAVIGLTMDDAGVPDDSERRLAIAHKIVERAEALGIPREDVIIDCLTMTVGADSRAGLVNIEAIRRVRADLGVNLSAGASNISFGMPDRNLISSAFLAISIAAGVNCPIIDVAKVRLAVLAADLVLGRDVNAMRYIRAYRQQQSIANLASI